MTEEERNKYNKIIKYIKGNVDKEYADFLEMYTQKLNKRIEKAYNSGFKDGQKENAQIQEYLDKVNNES